MADVALRSVAKRFGDITAVDDLSIHVENGELLVLLGPTGAGKTTTLRLVAGLERPDAGSVSIGGRDVTLEPPAVRDVAFVFQQYSLYPHQTVYDNLAFPLRSAARRMNEAEIRSRVHAIAELLHIEAKLGNRATRLSGGEMQRVAIGRALVRAPSIFLMDEPLSSLDAKLRAELRLELKHIQQDLGATVLYVTHDQTEAMTMANRIGVLDHGRLVQIGSPREIYERPQTPFVAEFIGASNLLPCVVEARGPDGTRLRVNDVTLLSRDPGPTSSADGGLVALIRPERIRLDSDGRAPAGSGNRFDAAVAAVTYLGEDLQLAVMVDGGPILTVSRKASGSEGEPGVGDRVVLTIAPEDVRILAVPQGTATS